MRALQYLQLDPLQIIARSQDITLHSRVLNYKPELWQDLTYKKRKFFDWGAWLAVRPMDELPYWRRVMLRERDGTYGDPRIRTLAKEHAEAIREMRLLLNERGTLSNRTVESDIPSKTMSYRGRKDSGIRRQSWLLAEEKQNGLGKEEQRHQRQGYDGDRPQAHAHGGAHAAAAAPLLGVAMLALDMRDHRRHRPGNAAAQQPKQEIDGIAQRAGGQRLFAEMAQHDGVGGQDRHLRQLGGGQRHSQAQQLAAFQQPGVMAVCGDQRSGRGQIGRRHVRLRCFLAKVCERAGGYSGLPGLCAV